MDAAGKLLAGGKHDSNPHRRKAVQRRIAEYLTRAEQLKLQVSESCVDVSLAPQQPHHKIPSGQSISSDGRVSDSLPGADNFDVKELISSTSEKGHGSPSLFINDSVPQEGQHGTLIAATPDTSPAATASCHAKDKTDKYDDDDVESMARVMDRAKTTLASATAESKDAATQIQASIGQWKG